jgi:hypothetical protein
MKWKFLLPLFWMIVASLTVFGQEKLYPVRSSRDAILTADRLAIVVERAFQHKLILGFPNEDRVSFVPDTRAPIIMLWLRIQNVSPRPMRFDAGKFTSTDDQGKMYPALVGDDAANRILAGTSDGSLGSKTLRGISLGRVGSKPTEEQLREDLERYSLQSGEIAPGAAKEGLIYFERPSQKKFTVKITLGDLWSQPLTFSTEKQK